MVYNSHATNQDLVSDIKFLLTGSATGTIDYGINDITRSCNRLSEVYEGEQSVGWRSE